MLECTRYLLVCRWLYMFRACHELFRVTKPRGACPNLWEKAIGRRSRRGAAPARAWGAGGRFRQRQRVAWGTFWGAPVREPLFIMYVQPLSYLCMVMCCADL